VTLNEARELLELGADAEGRAIRRAYLRAVKRHSPERDPEGFARMREAFELCRARPAYPSASVAPIPSAQPSRALLDRCYDPEITPQEQLTRAEQAIEQLPEDSAAFWAKFDALCALGDDEATLAWLRHGRTEGVENCLQQLAASAPHTLDDDDVAALLELRPFPTHLARALSPRAGERVAELLEQAMQTQEERQRFVGPEEVGDASPHFWSGHAIDVVLELVGQADFATAQRLYRRLRLHEQRVASPTRVKRARWLLTTELMQLPPSFPKRARARLGQAILALFDDPEQRPAAVRLRLRGALGARADGQLKHAAPNLHALIAKHTPAAPPSKRSPIGIGFLALILLSGLMRLCTHAASPSTASLRQPYGTLRLPVLPQVELTLASSDPAEFSRLQAAILDIHDRRCPGAGPLVCADLRAFSRAFSAERCADARVALDAASADRPAYQRAIPDPADRATLQIAVVRICPTPNSVGTLSTPPPPVDVSSSPPSREENHEISP